MQFCYHRFATLRPVKRDRAFCVSAWTIFLAFNHTQSRHERGYGSAWVKLREVILRRDGYLCQACKAKGRPTPATDVDHITPKAQGGTDAQDNLQALCRPCHKDKTAQEHGERHGKQKFGDDGWPVHTRTKGRG